MLAEAANTNHTWNELRNSRIVERIGMKTKRYMQAQSAIRYMVLFIIGFATSEAAVSEPSSYKARTLCMPSEKVIFSCPTGKKTLSLCASPDLTKDTGTLQYRFGIAGKKLELVYPRAAGHPREYFKYGDDNVPGQSAYRDLLFSINEYEYLLSVYTNNGTFEYGAEMAVRKEKKTIRTIECNFDRAINEIWELNAFGIPGLK